MEKGEKMQRGTGEQLHRLAIWFTLVKQRNVVFTLSFLSILNKFVKETSRLLGCRSWAILYRLNYDHT